MKTSIGVADGATEPHSALVAAPFTLVEGPEPLPSSAMPIVLVQEAGRPDTLHDPDSYTPTQKAGIAAVFWLCNPSFIDVTLDYIHRWAEAGVPVIYLFPARSRRPGANALAIAAEQFEMEPNDLWVRRKTDGLFVPSEAVLDKVEAYFSVRDEDPETHNYRKVTVTRWFCRGVAEVPACPNVAALMQAFATVHKRTPKV